MKTINTSERIKIPSDVKVSVNAGLVTVTGKKGILRRSFKTMQVDIHKSSDERELIVEAWFGNRKKNALVKTAATHIENMFTGVTKGYKYLMKLVYAHFPINVAVNPKGDTLEIKNFLGEKLVRRVKMLNGASIKLTNNKDELAIEGIDLEQVSQSCANVHTATLVKGKDIRKFLDGIYVSERTTQ